MDQTAIPEMCYCDCRPKEHLRSELNEPETIPFHVREWQSYRLRTGIAPESNEAVSRAGIYTDFT
jgi:hypothetical protein